MMDNPGFEGSFDVPNGDKCLILRNCKKLSGLLPADENTPISTAAYCRTSGWLQLEDRMCFRDRCMKRMKDVFLAEKALLYVQITHASMMVGPEEREPLIGELYTETEPVSYEALRRGHLIMPSSNLEEWL